MKSVILGIAFLMLPALAQGKPVKPLMFGDEWIAKDGEHHEARLDIYWASWANPLADFVRDPMIDKEKSALDTGPFPLPMPADETNLGYATHVSFAVSVGVDGAPSDCSILTKSQSEPVNAHICPHVLKYAKFHAPINEDGQRLSFRGEFTATYRTREKVVVRTVALPGDEISQPNSRDAAPAKKLDAKSLGINDSGGEARGRAAEMVINVDETGKAISCNLTKPTFVDSIDVILCRTALASNYVGALNYKGEPVTDWLGIEIKFSHADQRRRPYRP